MNGYFGIQPPSSAPWANLPTAAAPFGGSQQIWEPAQQAPWRLSPWSTQAMPAATPIAPPPVPAQSYLPQGTSNQIPGFNPMTPGGGFAPTPAPQPASNAGDLFYLADDQLFSDPIQAQNHLNRRRGSSKFAGRAIPPVATMTRGGLSQGLQHQANLLDTGQAWWQR